MRQKPASLIKYTVSILIFLSCLLIPLTSAFALGVTIRGPKEALVSEKAGLGANAWKESGTEIFIFSAEVFRSGEIKK